MRLVFALLLPHLILSSDEKDVCTICLDTMDRKLNDSLMTQCWHNFHVGCLAEWKNKHNSCPICRLDNPHALQLSQAEKNQMLEDSAYNGDLRIFKEMIRQGAEISSPTKNIIQGALWLAVTSGKTDAIEMLLKYGADIEESMPLMASGRLGRGTALMIAVVHGRIDSVEVLLRNGAFVDARDRLKLIPVAESSQIEVLNKGFEMTPLMLAARNRRGFSSQRSADIVEKLLEYGADIAARDNQGWTALDHAAKNFSGCSKNPSQTSRDHANKIVKLLLEKGAEPRIMPEIYRTGKVTPEIKELLESYQ